MRQFNTKNVSSTQKTSNQKSAKQKKPSVPHKKALVQHKKPSVRHTRQFQTIKAPVQHENKTFFVKMTHFC